MMGDYHSDALFQRYRRKARSSAGFYSLIVPGVFATKGALRLGRKAFVAPVRAARAARVSSQVINAAKEAAAISRGAESVNSARALRSKLSGLQKAQGMPAQTRILPDGRIRYYTMEIPASNIGPTRGASYVTEWNPVTGQVRSWMESYDQLGSINRIHPKMNNGQTLNSFHYPLTGRELKIR
jgi:hypothetical protein